MQCFASDPYRISYVLMCPDVPKSLETVTVSYKKNSVSSLGTGCALDMAENMPEHKLDAASSIVFRVGDVFRSLEEFKNLL